MNHRRAISLMILFCTMSLSGCDSAKANLKVGPVAGERATPSNGISTRMVKLEITSKPDMTLCEKDGFKLTEETALDTHSGLMWPRDMNMCKDAMLHDDAVTYVSNLNFGGYHDWRVPSKEEAHALLSYAASDSSAPYANAVFHNVDGSTYWTSSLNERGAYYKIGVKFDPGVSNVSEGSSEKCKVLPVRYASH